MKRLGFLLLLLAYADASALGNAQSGWNQPRGDAASTASSSFEPIRDEPVEEWRHDLGERILGEPVSWGGVVYAAAKDGRQTKLYAISARGGEVLARVGLGKGDQVWIGVWQGTVVVVEPELVRLYTHKQDVLRKRKTLKVGGDALAIHEGFLLCSDGERIHCVDVQRMKVVGSVRGGAGRPAVRRTGEDEAMIATYSIGTHSMYEGLWIFAELAVLAGIGGKETELRRRGSADVGRVRYGDEDDGGYVARVEESGLWFVRSPRAFVGVEGDGHGATLPDAGDGKLAPIVTDAAVHDGEVFGFSPDGTLIRFLPDGRFQKVISAEDLPSGAQPGPATIASGVLYVRNWAVDLGSRRVLWNRDELAVLGPLVPVDDARAAYVTENGELVGLADCNVLGVAEAVADAASHALPIRPDAGDVVILVDGEVRGGPDAEAGLDPEDIAFLGTGEEAQLVGEEFSVFVAWRNALYAEHCAELEELIDSYRKSLLIEDCRRLLEEACELGLSAARARDIEDLLAGKRTTQSANADAKRRKKQREERVVREELVASFVEAADWCRARELDVAATALLARAEEALPEVERGELMAKAAELVPPAFPWREEEDAAQRWLEWADEILPAGASFVPRSDPLWSRLNDTWSKEAIALRTKNLEILSLDHDPQVLGLCLRKGEGTLRALDELLANEAEDGDRRLQVRIHADKESYQAELKAKNVRLEWSAGVYSPSEQVSRFYVPREKLETEERELHYVLAHELTHHYLDQRWMNGGGRNRPNQPGYWIVEGFARFVEDQVLELGRADRSFDDPTVKSLDAAAALEELDALIPLKDLVDLTQQGFMHLDDEQVLLVQLRYTLQKLMFSTRAVFYDQAASLVFFLVNRAGPEKRELLIEYMRDFYSGKTQASGWKALGWSDVDELDRELRAFLGTIGE